MLRLNRGADEHQYPTFPENAVKRRKGISAEGALFACAWAYGLIPV